MTLNGIVSHEDWLPTFAAIAGDTNVNDRLLKGATINGRSYKNHLDGVQPTGLSDGQDKSFTKK